MGENVLDKIIVSVKEKIKERSRKISLKELESKIKTLAPPINVVTLLKERRKIIIAEIKRASPSKGVIKEFDSPVKVVKEYVEGGADAISVLTEESYFKGSLDDLRITRESFSGPILRKDFIIEAYQVAEARACGADFYLLISEILELSQMKELVSYGRKLGMEPLIELHSESELEKVMECKPSLIGINNRDLKTFQVNLKTTERISKLIPNEIYRITESGINSDEDIILLSPLVDGFLIGERLMREEKPSLILKKWKKLISCDKK